MSNSNHRRKRQAPADSPCPSFSNNNDDAVDSYTDELLSLPGTATYVLQDDGSLTQESRAPRRRRRFTWQRRNEVAKVRKVGACEVCRRRKVACKHVLQRTEIPAELPRISKTGPPPPPVDFESLNPDLTLNGNAGNVFKPDESYTFSADGSDFFGSADSIQPIPTPTQRRDKVALDLHDYENIIEDNPGANGFIDGSEFSQWNQDGSWLPNSVTDDQYHVKASPASEHSNTILSSELLSTRSQSALSHTNSVSTFEQDATNHRCFVPGCDYGHEFAEEIDLRRHKESRHANLFSPKVTYTCPHCRQHSMQYVRLENLQAHIICNHPEVLDGPVNLPNGKTTDSDPLQFGKRAQVEKYIDGGYFPGMDNSIFGFPKTPGENMSYMLETGQSTGGNQPNDRAQGSRRVPRRPSMRQNNLQVPTQTSDGSVPAFARSVRRYMSPTEPNRGNHVILSDSDVSLMPTTQTGQANSGMSGVTVGYMIPQDQSDYLTSPEPTIGDPLSPRCGIGLPSRGSPMLNGFQDGFSTSGTGEQHSGLSGLMQNISLHASAPVRVFSNRQSLPSSRALGSGFFDKHDALRPHPICNDLRSLPERPESRGTAWSGQYPAHERHSEENENDIMPHSFPQNDYDHACQCLLREGSSMSFLPRASGYGQGPFIAINGSVIPEPRIEGDISFVQDGFNSDPCLSRSNWPPPLDESLSFSSGANDSLTSPLEVPNLQFPSTLGNDKYPIDLNFEEMIGWAVPPG